MFEEKEINFSTPWHASDRPSLNLTMQIIKSMPFLTLLILHLFPAIKRKLNSTECALVSSFPGEICFYFKKRYHSATKKKSAISKGK